MSGAVPSCHEVTELVTDYVEGHMSWGERLRFQLHLGLCRHCRQYLRQIQATRRLLGVLPPEPPPPDVEAELLRRFRSFKRS